MSSSINFGIAFQSLLDVNVETSHKRNIKKRKDSKRVNMVFFSQTRIVFFPSTGPRLPPVPGEDQIKPLAFLGDTLNFRLSFKIWSSSSKPFISPHFSVCNSDQVDELPQQCVTFKASGLCNSTSGDVQDFMLENCYVTCGNCRSRWLRFLETLTEKNTENRKQWTL